MTCGIQYPAIQLLSLHNPYNLNPEIKLEKPKHVTEMCYLPKPYFALKMYVFLFICTLFILAGVFFQSLFNLLRFEQLKLKRNDDYQLTDNRWKPQKDLIINNLNKRRNIGEFFINGLILSFLIYVLFGIYYKFIQTQSLCILETYYYKYTTSFKIEKFFQVAWIEISSL